MHTVPTGLVSINNSPDAYISSIKKTDTTCNCLSNCKWQLTINIMTLLLLECFSVHYAIVEAECD